MNLFDGMKNKLGPFRIVVIYAAISFFYIYFSDTVVGMFARDPKVFTAIAITKGSIFVLVTAILLYFLIRRDMLTIIHSQKAQQKSDKLLRDTGRTAKIGGWEIELSTRIIYWTEEIYRIHEVESGVPIDFDMAINFFAPESRPVLLEAIRRATADGAPYDLELPLITAQGRRLWVRTTAQPDRVDGRVEWLRGTLQDITDRKLTQERVHKIANELRVTLDTVTAGISHIKDRKIEWANKAHSELFGYSIGEMYGMETSLFYPDRASFERLGQESNLQFLDGKTYSTEIEMCKKDGTRFWCNMTGRQVDTAHPAEGAIWVIQDNTERRRSDELLRENEAKFRVIFENSRDAIGVSKKGIHYFANPAYLKLFGFKNNEEIVGRSIFDSIAPSHHQAMINRTELRSNGKSVESFYEARVMKVDGTEFDAEFNVSTYLIKDEIYSMAVIRDITNRKQAERNALELAVEKAAAEVATQKAVELALAYEKLHKTQAMLIQTEKLSAIGTLSAGVAHELNSPLAGILELARFYLDHKNPGDREYRDLKQIVEAGEHMSKIIKGLRDFSRPSAEENEKLNCNDLIEKMLEFSQRIISGPDVHIHKDFENDLPMFKGDKNQIQQIILNLISNAADAMQKNGILKISTRKVMVSDTRFVEMEFKDNGCGISKENQLKIFDPFFTTKEQGKGTGLGLWVVYSIIKQHNGEILIESPPVDQGTGTLVKVRMPAVS